MESIKNNTLKGYEQRIVARLARGSFSPISFAGDHIAGTQGNASTGEARAALLHPDGHVHPLIEQHSFVQSASSSGMVCGTIGYGERPFLYRPNESPIILTTPPGTRYSHAEDVNKFGEVVGSVEDEEGESAILWRDGHTLVLESGCHRATHISDSGWIAGVHHSGLFRYRAGTGFQILTEPGAKPQALAECGTVIYRTSSIWAWTERGDREPIELGELVGASITGIAESGVLIGFGTDSGGELRSFIRDPHGSLLTIQGHPSKTRLAGIASDGRIVAVADRAPGIEISVLQPV